MKISLKYIAAGAVLVAGLLDNANAVPAFARQMGVSCSACHSENGYPALTRFGREFKASGYTMIGSEKVVGGGKTLSDKLISLPSALNMSVVGGTTIDSGSGSTGTTVATNNFGMFLGGRISENIGTWIEIGYSEGDTATPQHFELANFVVPITFKMGENYLGIVPYNTDGHTATASEFYDNGGFAAISHIGARDVYGAKGLSLYVYNPNYFINYTAWANGNKSTSGMKLANYFRVAYTPQVGIWDLEFGLQYMTGNTNDADGDGYVTDTTIKKKTNAYSIDFNAMGKVNKMPLDIEMSYAKAKYDPDSLFTTNTDHKDGKSFVFDAKLGVIPKTLVAMIDYSYDDHAQDSNDKVKTTQLAFRYFITENAKIEPYYNIISGHADNAANADTYGIAFEVAF